MKKNISSYKLGFLLIDGFALMSFSAVVEPLRAANLIAQKSLYEIDYYSIEKPYSQSSSGAIIESTKALNNMSHLDFLFVVAGKESTSFEDQNIFKLLKRMAKQELILGGVSGGPVILAKAGVLKNRRFTVHWEHAPGMREMFPELIIERTLYIRDRDRYTCAGGVAPLDMMNAMITQHHGNTFAQQVNDWFIHTEIRTSASPQRSGLSERYPNASQAMILAIEAMRNHIADPLDLEQLARLSEVSVRQLNRLFKEKLGIATMDFYRQQRLQTAEKLLNQSSMKMIDIANATGFMSAAHFSSAFNKHFGQTPSSLRKKS
ncbi:MAG: transcriptional regulator GlxA family with amidase domain [Cocleimonas sp.]|jgi:transcriptional regulator GlxA family with amidase domain